MATEAMSGATRRILFGPFEYDQASGSLHKHGIRVRLQGQPLRILSALLRRPGQVISRDEFQRDLWHESTFVDFEHGLNAAVNRLRETLGDSAEHPRYIETLPGRGYRFIASVKDLSPQPVLPKLAPAVDKRAFIKGHHWKRPRLAWIIVAAALVTAIAGGYLAGRRHGVPRQNVTSQQILRFTSLPGVETMPAFSPDGRQVAYVHSERDPLALHFLGRQVAQANIYVKLIGAGTELRVTNHRGADYHPAWSPDGEYIAFYRDEPGASGYYMVSALGGLARRITDEQAASSGIAWFPGGRQLAISHVSEGSHASPLLELSVDNGKRRQLTFPPTGTLGDAWPAVSPDGKTLAFTRIKDAGAFDLCLMRVPEGAAHCLAIDAMLPAGLAWTAVGDALIGASMIKMAPRLWRYDLRNATLSMLTSGEEVAEYPAVSRQGTLAYIMSTRRVSIYQLDLASSVRARGPITPIAYSSKVHSDPAFSPDARKLAFLSVRGGSPEIWVTAIDDQTSTQLTHAAGLTGSPSWSPDGKYIAFDSANGAGSQIYVVAADGGAPRQITAAPGENVVPSWSHDGIYVYFSSNRSGDFQIWKCQADTGETQSHPAFQMTQKGGFRAFESVDGSYLYYAKGRGKPGLWRRGLLSHAGIEQSVLGSLQQWGWWALGTKLVYFLELPYGFDPQVRLKALDINTGLISEIAKLPFPVLTLAPALAVSRDGQHLAFPQIDSMEADIMLRQNIN